MKWQNGWASPSTHGIYLSWKGFVVDCRYGIHLSCFRDGNLGFLKHADLRVVLRWILGRLIAADTLQAMCAVLDTCKVGDVKRVVDSDDISILKVENDKVVIVHGPTGYEVGQSGKEDFYLHDGRGKEPKYRTKYGITTPNLPL